MHFWQPFFALNDTVPLILNNYQIISTRIRGIYNEDVPLMKDRAGVSQIKQRKRIETWWLEILKPFFMRSFISETNSLKSSMDGFPSPHQMATTCGFIYDSSR